ncbi:MAG: hypothetical protein ACI4WM_08210 [Erysipelotrichaceae bacterium]
MKTKNIKKLSDEKLERVTGGMIIDNTDWISLYMSKYRPRLISGLNEVDSISEKSILEWCIRELDKLTFKNRLDFLNEISRIQDEIGNRIVSTRPRSTVVVILPRRILDEIKIEAEFTKD